MKGQVATGELPLMTEASLAKRSQGISRQRGWKTTACDGRESYRRAMVSSFHGDNYFDVRAIDASFLDGDFIVRKRGLRSNKAKKEALSFFDGDPYALLEVPDNIDSTHFCNGNPFSVLSVESKKYNMKNYNDAKSRNIFTNTSQTNNCSDNSSLSGACDSCSGPLRDELEVCDLPQNVPARRIKREIQKKSEILNKGMYSNIHENRSNGDNQKNTGDSRALPLSSDSGALSSLVLSDISTSEIMPQVYQPNWVDSPRQSSSRTLLEEGGTLMDVEEGCQCQGYHPNELDVKPRSLSQKYRPKVFEELIGQELSVRCLSNVIQKREEVSAMYLFGGPRGTGKTSAARIFATALNCCADQKPCGICIALKSPDITEIDAASHNGLEMVKALFRDGSLASSDRFKVFIVDECHMLTNETWNMLLNLFERPRRKVVFILTTTDPERVPPNALCRCRKVAFQKINDLQIVERLQNLAKLESLDVEPGVLDLIAWRSDGSLRDAEIVLDQLSLLGERITLSTVHELFGSVSKEKLLGLLAFALCSDTIHTVQSARELINSGVEPLDLLSQLGTVMRDILSRSKQERTKEEKDEGCFSGASKLSKEGLERLRIALQILSDTEKQLKEASYDKTTWLTAALLQFGPGHSAQLSVSSPDTNAIRSSSEKPYLDEIKEIPKMSKKKHVVQLASAVGGIKPMWHSEKKRRHKAQIHPEKMVTSSASSQSRNTLHAGKQLVFQYLNKEGHASIGRGNLQGLWHEVLKDHRLLDIKELLEKYGTLSTVSITPGGAAASLEFFDPKFKSQSEKHQNVISSAFEMILGLPVDVKMSINMEIKECKQKGPEIQSSEGLNNLNKAESFKEISIFRDVTPRHVSSSQNLFHGTRSEMPNMTTVCSSQAIDSEPVDSTQEISRLDNHANTPQEKHTSHGCISMECCSKDQFYNLEAENLMLEPQSKYGGVLCWMSPEVDDDQVFVQHTRKGCGLLTKMVQCTK